LREAPPLVRAPGNSEWQREDLMRLFGQYPTFKSAGSLRELSSLAGFPEKAFAETVQRYNAAQRSGRDWLGRQHMPRKMAEPPYYAICHQGSSLLSFAG